MNSEYIFAILCSVRAFFIDDLGRVVLVF